MSANTLASALAAARKCSLPPAVQAQSIRLGLQAVAAIRPPVAAVPDVAALPAVLSNADALMIAIQRSARTVDDIMTRRMLLASGCRGAAAR
jgi:hypothetical protein